MEMTDTLQSFSRVVNILRRSPLENQTEQIFSTIIEEYSKEFDMILWSIDFWFFIQRKMNLMIYDTWD